MREAGQGVGRGSAPARASSLAVAALERVAPAGRVLDYTLWCADGERPQLVVTDAIPRLRGATLFELDLLPLEGCGGPTALCFDFGEGFEEARAVALSPSPLSHKSCSAIVELRAPPRRIRIDACLHPGRFACSELRLAPMAPIDGAAGEELRLAAVVDLSRGELWPEVAQYLGHIGALERLYVCLPDETATAVEEQIVARYPRAILRHQAAGESGAAACLRMLELAADQGAELVCMIHTRASAHVQGSDAGRWDMTHKLVGSAAIVEDILAAFRDEASLGIVAPAGHVLAARHSRDLDAARVRDCCARLGIEAGILEADFVAGSMFWARVEALRPLRRLREDVRSLAVAREVDRAIASPIDRCLPAAMAMRGFRLAETRVADTATKSAFDFAAPALLEEAFQDGAGRAPSGARAPEVALVPLAGLNAIDPAAGEWAATHNDPQFVIEGLAAYAGRWVLVVTNLRAEFSAQLPTIHFDFGAGWTALGAAALARPAAVPGGESETVCWVPPGVRRARLDPIAYPGRFGLTRFEVRPLTVVRAIERMRDALGDRDAPTSLERLFPAYSASRARVDTSYASWIRHYEQPREQYGRLREAQSAWRDPPTISLAVDARGATPSALVASLIGQLYPHWELWIAQDGPLEAGDPRVRRMDLRSTGAAAMANAALQSASGAFFAVPEPGDVLHPLALHYVAEAALAHPGCAVLYTDEDRMGSDGARRDPWFKCHLNYELLLAMDMVSRLACYRTELVRKIGGFSETLPDAARYDLALRVVEAVDPGQVVHVPRVLCHAADAATRGDGESSRRAVVEHLGRAGCAAEVLAAPGAPAGMNRVRFAVPQPAPAVRIVIPTRDRAELLRACLDSILGRTTYPRYAITIVDNGSVEPATHELLESCRAKGMAVLRDDSEFNFSALNNRAVAATSEELVCLMNNDIVVLTPEWLDEMVGMAARAGVGAVGARLWYPDRRLQHAGLVLGIAGVAGYAHKLLPAGEPGYACRAILHQSFSAVTAACMLVRKAVYEEVGGLDETFPVAFNDLDFCLRLRDAGYRNVWTPYAEMLHDESATRGHETTPEKALRFQRDIDRIRERWGERLFADPAYSPNLTLDAEDFSLAWPPRPST